MPRRIAVAAGVALIRVSSGRVIVVDPIRLHEIARLLYYCCDDHELTARGEFACAADDVSQLARMLEGV